MPHVFVRLLSFVMNLHAAIRREVANAILGISFPGLQDRLEPIAAEMQRRESIAAAAQKGFHHAHPEEEKQSS